MACSAPGRAIVRAARAPAAVLGLYLVLRAISGELVRWPPLNLAAHLVGGLAVAHLFLVALGPVADACAGRARALVRAVGTFALTTTTAVAWEFFECVLARIQGVRGPSDPGDTLQDIAAGMAGGVLLIASRVWRAWRRSSRAGGGGSVLDGLALR